MVSPGRSSDFLHSSSDAKRLKQKLPSPIKEQAGNGIASSLVSWSKKSQARPESMEKKTDPVSQWE